MSAETKDLREDITVTQSDILLIKEKIINIENTAKQMSVHLDTHLNSCKLDEKGKWAALIALITGVSALLGIIATGIFGK